MNVRVAIKHIQYFSSIVIKFCPGPLYTDQECKIAFIIMCVFFAVSTTTCSDLTAPTNGIISYNAETMDTRPVNTVATFTCNTGDMVTGDMTRTCGAGGMWSGTDPTCTRKLLTFSCF